MPRGENAPLDYRNHRSFAPGGGYFFFEITSPGEKLKYRGGLLFLSLKPDPPKRNHRSNAATPKK